MTLVAYLWYTKIIFISFLLKCEDNQKYYIMHLYIEDCSCSGHKGNDNSDAQNGKTEFILIIYMMFATKKCKTVTILNYTCLQL